MTKEYHSLISFVCAFLFYICLIFFAGGFYYSGLLPIIGSIVGMMFCIYGMIWSGMTWRDFIGLKSG